MANLLVQANNHGALNLEMVRDEAHLAGLYEIYYNEQSRVISFAATDDHSSPVRVNVYYTTGTVGTCLTHPHQGKTQLFRRNVDLSMLAKLFREPRLHTGTGYHRRSNNTTQQAQPLNEEIEQSEEHPKNEDPKNEEAELRVQAVRLKEEADKVDALLAACVARRVAERQATLDKIKSKINPNHACLTIAVIHPVEFARAKVGAFPGGFVYGGVLLLDNRGAGIVFKLRGVGMTGPGAFFGRVTDVKEAAEWTYSNGAGYPRGIDLDDHLFIWTRALSGEEQHGGLSEAAMQEAICLPGPWSHEELEWVLTSFGPICDRALPRM